MAKKTKEAKPTVKKQPKPKAPVDPVKTRNLVRLLNLLALLLAIAAFLLQLFAVISRHWKWQSTALHPIMTHTNQHAPPDIHEDSFINQNYGLYSRDVRLQANNDERLDVLTGTRFPRADDGEGPLRDCLYQTSTLRGAFLTCSKRVMSPKLCHCRRYPYWNAVIFFEVLALILLGLAVFVAALFSTHLHGILKLAAAGLSLLALLCMLIGLILILSHLKRETRSIADAYPYIYNRLAEKFAVPRNTDVLRHAVRRQVHETYRAYTLLEGQHPYNDTHYQEYSEQLGGSWIYKPYSGINQRLSYVPYASPAPRERVTYTAYPRLEQTAPRHGPVDSRHESGDTRHGISDTRHGISDTRHGISDPRYATNDPRYVANDPRYATNDPRYVANELRPATSDQRHVTSDPRYEKTAAPVAGAYRPLLGYDKVFEHTRAGLGWSTVLSMLAMIPALLAPLIGLFSWITNKKLGSDVKTVTTTTVETKYVPVPQDVTVETTPLKPVTVETIQGRPIPVDYDPRRPIGDAIVTAKHPREGPYDTTYTVRAEPTVIHDVVIHDEPQVTRTIQQHHSFPVNIETTQPIYRN